MPSVPPAMGPGTFNAAGMMPGTASAVSYPGVAEGRPDRSRSPSNVHHRMLTHMASVGAHQEYVPVEISTGNPVLDHYLMKQILPSLSQQAVEMLKEMGQTQRSRCMGKAQACAGGGPNNPSIWVTRWFENWQSSQKQQEYARQNGLPPPGQPQGIQPGVPFVPAPPRPVWGTPQLARPQAPPGSAGPTSLPTGLPSFTSDALPLTLGSRVPAEESTTSRNTVPSPGSSDPRAIQRPDWATAGLTAFKENRVTEMCKQVFSQLGSETVAIMAAQTSRMQGYVCFSLCLNPMTWRDLDKSAATLIKLLDSPPAVQPQPQSQQPQPQDGAAQNSAMERILFNEFHLFAGCGVSILVMFLARKMLKEEFPNVEMAPSCLVCWEIEPKARAVIQRLCEKLDLQVVLQEDVWQWPAWLRSEFEGLPGGVKHSVVTSGSPCNVTTNCQKYGLDTPTALCTHPSNACWPAHEGLAMLEDKNDNRTAHLIEHTLMRLPPDEAKFDRCYGPSVTNSDSDRHYGATKRNRTVRASPARPQPLEHKAGPRVDPGRPIGDWTWCGNADSTSGTVKLTLRSFIPRLLEDLMDKENPRKLDEWEKETLISMRMKNSEGEIRYVSRDFWYLWLGHTNLPIAEVFDELFPCFGTIIPMTGQNAPPGCGEPCGVQRYCNNCEEVVKMLGRSWDVRTWTDITYAWLKSLMQEWATSLQTPPDLTWHPCRACDVHHCGPTCPHRLQPGQYYGGA